MGNDETQEGFDQPDRTMTLVDDIKVNDGFMQIKIVGSEIKKNPKAFGKDYVVYIIHGSDNLGEFQIIRRYKEFHLFRDLLFARYPGLYIPPLPQKQFQGNKAENFVEERKFFLNLFLENLTRQSYLISTPEVQVFIRPRGECFSSLRSLER
jgi:hypothetical protein